jgi:hypothetical protein
MMAEMSGVAAESLGMLLAAFCFQIGVPLLLVERCNGMLSKRLESFSVWESKHSNCINPLRHPNGYLHVPPRKSS